MVRIASSRVSLQVRIARSLSLSLFLSFHLAPFLSVSIAFPLSHQVAPRYDSLGTRGRRGRGEAARERGLKSVRDARVIRFLGPNRLKRQGFPRVKINKEKKKKGEIRSEGHARNGSSVSLDRDLLPAARPYGGGERL